MKSDNLERELGNVKYQHLTEDEIDSYHGQTLDTIGRAMVEAHLNLCLICERRLALLKEESAALEDRESTAEDIALVRRVMKQMGSERQLSGSKPDAAIAASMSERVTENLRQAAASWQAHFRQLKAARGAVDSGEEIWRWESEDGLLKVRAVLEKNADLKIHFSSNEPGLEGARFIIRLGPVSREATLQRVSESEVSAKVRIPRRQRPKNLADIAIERVR